MEWDVETLRGRRADDRWNRLSVGDFFERVTWATPDKVALVGWEGAFAEGRFARVTYRQGDEITNRIAHGLAAEGLNSGDRVVLVCDNSIEAILLLFGIARAGMVAVPLNPNLAPDVLAYELAQAEPGLVVIESGAYARFAHVLAEAGLSPRVCIELGDGHVPGAEVFGAWVDRFASIEVSTRIHGDDIWELLYTSGTTAMPKASMTAHSYSYWTAYSYAMSLTRGLDYESDLVMCSFLPIVYHCGHNSTVMPALICGGTVVVGRRPDADALADAISAESVTAVWAGSPLWVQKLVDAAEGDPARDLASLTVVMFSWGAMAPDLIPRLKAESPAVRLLEVFGQTESQSCLKFWPDQEPTKMQEALQGVNHVGRPTPLLAADIHDAEGRTLRGRPGEAGEAVYRSPCLTMGYYRNAEATAEAFRDGWFHSGDSCTYTEDGSQIMVDRFKDIVKSGGENVSSLRVESVLQSHPSVGRVAVVGVPHERWGEMVVAVVIPADGAVVSEAELVDFARARLSGFETPKRVVVTDTLPETVGGKVIKVRLRESLAAEGGLAPA